MFPLVVFVEESVGVVPVKHVEHRERQLFGTTPSAGDIIVGKVGTEVVWG